MALLATPEDFDEGGLYDPAYHDMQMFAVRAERLIADHHRCRVAVWGCAYGFLVRRLLEAGFDAHGFDASGWAIGRGFELQPELAGRLHVADATRDRRGGFALVVTEDMLPCLSDREIAQALPLLRVAPAVHIVTAHGPGAVDDRLNWKTLDQWRQVAGDDELRDQMGVPWRP